MNAREKHIFGFARHETTFIVENRNQPNALQAKRCADAFSARRFSSPKTRRKTFVITMVIIIFNKARDAQRCLGRFLLFVFARFRNTYVRVWQIAVCYSRVVFDRKKNGRVIRSNASRVYLRRTRHNTE